MKACLKMKYTSEVPWSRPMSWSRSFPRSVSRSGYWYWSLSVSRSGAWSWSWSRYN